jgi:hypothetical protein
MTRLAQAWVRVGVAGVVAAGLIVSVAAQAAPSASGAKAKELESLMEARKLEAFGMRESPISDRYFAVMVVPKVQMLVVSAIYTRPSDMEYFLYHKDYASMYRNLAGGALTKERFFVEDVLGDGLVAVPVKNAPPDSVKIDSERQLFTGPADPKKRNDTRMPADAYAKSFADADARYTKLLDALIDELKKPGTLAPDAFLR